MDKWRFRLLGILTLILISTSFAEKVARLTYTGIPEDINDSTIQIPSQAVYMSEKVLVGQPTEIIEGTIDTSTPPSIFFVIDHSGSMFYKSFTQENTTQSARDRWGARFRVTRDLIDSIKAVFPDAEVGFSVFGTNLYFDPTQDDLFEKVTGNNEDNYSGAYIPLLKLNQEYEYSEGTASGYDILKHYLDTDTNETSNSDQTFLDLKYKPNNTALDDASTNITAGFDAVKDAFKSATYPKNKQYVIFFSDGVATQPSNNDEEKLRFLNGIDNPTLFTVFFSPTGDIPPMIDSLTTVVKNNGYSESNVETNAWSIEANYETLMTTLLDNVFSIINTKSVSKPLEVTVNGKIPDGKPELINGEYVYTFSSSFPFTGEKNDFDYKIHYEVIFQDTIDTTITHTKDTTIYSNFTIELSDAATLPDGFKLDSWDRSIKFYTNNRPINEASEVVSELEVRFEVSKVDMFYGYSEVTLEIFSGDSIVDSTGAFNGYKKFDTEICKLTSIDSTDSGQIFSKKLPLAIDDVTKNNNKLETDGLDNFFFVFRNFNKPKLPLDTLVRVLPYSVSGSLLMDEATYFDKKRTDGTLGADGLVDSIYISLSNMSNVELDKADVDTLVKNIKLPGYRNFKVIKSELNNYGISINVEEEAQLCNTSINETKDSIELKQIVLPNGGWINGSKILPKDKIAPVIVSATAIQYEASDSNSTDSLIVKFSEPIEQVNGSEPFHLYAFEEDEDYNISVNFLSNNKDKQEMVFEITDISGADIIHFGDSIWINENSDVEDEVGNRQDHENNIKRVIKSVYNEKPFDIKVEITGPIDLTEPNDKSIIDTSIIKILDPENKELLKEDKNGDIHGILIVGETVGEDTSETAGEVELTGTFAIYDCLGSTVSERSKMSFDPESKALFYVWSGKNMKGRFVGGGTYVALMDIKSISKITGETIKNITKKKFIAIKE